MSPGAHAIHCMMLRKQLARKVSDLNSLWVDFRQAWPGNSLHGSHWAHVETIWNEIELIANRDPEVVNVVVGAVLRTSA